MTEQVFSISDLPIVLLLVLLEGLLSADNALVLAIMVRHLPQKLQKKALLYGLGGAFVFRGIAILLAGWIIELWWLQAIGALYLFYLPIRHFIGHSSSKEKVKAAVGASFWVTVIQVEFADIAFAIDSVLAAVAMVGDPSKLWVVYLGAIVGIVLLRVAAGIFINLLLKFPHLDHLAYILIGWVAVKLFMMAGHNFSLLMQEERGWTFEMHEMSHMMFWSVMLVLIVGGGFIATRHKQEVPVVEGVVLENLTPEDVETVATATADADSPDSAGDTQGTAEESTTPPENQPPPDEPPDSDKR